jgi:hypothetical protein
VHKEWAIIRREFVERVRTKWFWISAVLGPVLFAGIIVFQIVQSVGGGVRNIAVVDSTSRDYGRASWKDSPPASRFERRSSCGPGVMDSLTQWWKPAPNGFLIISDSLTETGKASTARRTCPSDY